MQGRAIMMGLLVLVSAPSTGEARGTAQRVAARYLSRGKSALPPGYRDRPNQVGGPSERLGATVRMLPLLYGHDPATFFGHPVAILATAKRALGAAVVYALEPSITKGLGGVLPVLHGTGKTRDLLVALRVKGAARVKLRGMTEGLTPAYGREFRLKGYQVVARRSAPDGSVVVLRARSANAMAMIVDGDGARYTITPH